MSITEYDNVAKWVKFFKGLPWWPRSIIIIGIVGFLSIWGYCQWGPVRQLKSDNSDLKNKLAIIKGELATVRDTKNELHRENLHFKELIDPIQRKAELLYPELETAAAITKLAEDLQEVRSLATRDVYKPLASDRKGRMIAALRALQAQALGHTLSLTIVVQQGSSARAKVAADLERYLQDAGWKVNLQSGMSFYNGTPPDISIKMHPEDVTIAQKLANIIGTLFINKQFAGIKEDKVSQGHFEIKINGDPLFTESGNVTFR